MSLSAIIRDILLGGGAVYAASSKQKLNSKASTEAELVGVSDGLTQGLWTRNFLRAVRMAENPKILRYTTTRVFRQNRPDVFRVFEFSGAPPRHTDKTPLECPKTEYLGNSII